MKFGVFDKLNATMTKFTLINNHDWKDKQEIQQEVTNKDNSIKVKAVFVLLFLIMFF